MNRWRAGRLLAVALAGAGLAPLTSWVQPAAAACATARPDVATDTRYLPNLTKTLGGLPTTAGGPASHGWSTPFLVQNTGDAPTTLELTFYRMDNGECAIRRVIPALAPNASFAYAPDRDPELPEHTQFSVVVRSFGSTVAAVVNQHRDADEVFGRAEAMSYRGFRDGATRVNLPNVTRRYGAAPPHGYVSPFVIQNLGTQVTVATASFVSFDGASRLTVTRTIPPLRSQVVDPRREVGLSDGTQYAVTITSAQPIAVVENVHNDAPASEAGESAPNPVAYSVLGIAQGATVVYAPYAAKNANGVGRVSTVVVQNLGSAGVRPVLTFTPLARTGAPAAAAQTFTATADVQPGASWAFDPRFDNGTTTPCTRPSASCLGDGEYSLVATAGGPIAAVVNVISEATAMGYTALTRPESRVFLPNVTRTLGGANGWTTPLLLQAVSASGATLRWYRLSDGALVLTHQVAIASGTGTRVDPRDVAGLADDSQYSVVADGTGGTLAAIVIQLDGARTNLAGGDVHYATSADNAMIYEGFAGTVD